MNKHTLAVIMPNYNHAQYIGEALDSILTQSFRPATVLVIDDGSDDNSIEVIERFIAKDSVISLLRNEVNSGAVFSVNKGLKHISEDYVYVAAADDIILPGLFEKSMNLLNKYPHAAICCSDTKTIWQSGQGDTVNKRGLGDKSCYISPEELVKIMQKKIVYLSGFGTIIKRKELLETGMPAELKWCGDRIYALTIALRYGLCYIPEMLAAQLRRKDSYSEQGQRNRKEHKQVIENILELLKKPQYADVLFKFKKSCALASLGMPMLRVLFFSPKHRDYLSFNLMRLILWSEFKNAVGAYIPVVIKKIYRSLAKNR